MPKALPARALCAAVFVLLFFTLMPTRAAAAENGAPATVRINCGANDALYLAEGGIPAGYFSDYLDAIAKSNNWKFEYVEGSFTDSTAALERGEIDLIFPIQKTPEREASLVFSEICAGYQPIGLFAAEDAGIYYDDYAAFDGKRIAVAAGSSNATSLAAFAKVHGFTYTPVDINSVQDKVDALRAGQVDLLAFSTYNPVEGTRIVAMLDYLPFYFAALPENEPLLRELDDGIKHLMATHPDLYANATANALESSTPLAYTKEEASIIARTEKLTVGVLADSPPLFSVADDGSYAGIYVGLLDRLSKLTGIPIEICPVDRTHKIYSYLDSSQVDFIMASTGLLSYASGAQGGGYHQTSSLLDTTTVAVTLPTYHFSDTSRDKFALTNARDFFVPYIMAHYPNAEITYYNSEQQCMDALFAGKADITLLNSWEYNYQSKNARFQGMMEWESLRLNGGIALATGQSIDPALASLLDKAIAQLRLESTDELVFTNLNMGYASYSWRDTLYSMRFALLLLLVGVLLLALVAGLTTARAHTRKRIYEVENSTKQAQNDALKTALEDANRANRAKTEFLSRMSHDMRTPLNSIINFTRFIEASDSLEETKTLAGKVLTSTGYLQTLINDTLGISRIESGKVELHPAPCTYAEFEASIRGVLDPKAAAKGVELRFEAPETEGRSILIDKLRLQQIFINITNNAIKFTPAGGTVLVETSLRDRTAQGETLAFRITDTGCGISPEFLPHIFEPFQQERTGQDDENTGTGLGLSIVKRLVDLMGGAITCTSTPGDGTTFAVTLPVKLAAPGQAPAAAGPDAAARYTPGDLQGARVLLCEDHPLNREIALRLLKTAGCTAVTAANGREGVEAVRAAAAAPFDLILMDIRMPELDGMDATREIRAYEQQTAARRTPIIAMTANVYEEDVKAYLTLGMDAHVAKPIDPAVLYTVMKRFYQAEGQEDAEAT